MLFSFVVMKPYSGSCSKCRLRTYINISSNYFGRPPQRMAIGVASFFYVILSYFSFLLFAFRFCQGRLPFRKYINTYMRLSRSSLLPCSIPICVFIEAYRAVPVRFLLSRYGMCCPSLFLYRLAKPKSIMYTFADFFLVPIKKLSGLTSRCSMPFECTYLIS